jgi:hypothetical protein
MKISRKFQKDVKLRAVAPPQKKKYLDGSSPQSTFKIASSTLRFRSRFVSESFGATGLVSP